MRAMLLESKTESQLLLREVPKPKAKEGQLVVKVLACGVCRTDLHILDQELPPPHLPLILGHQIVGTITELGPKTKRFQIGQRVGIPWLGKTCQQCRFCLSQRENLCENPLLMGYHLNGGYAEFCAAYEDYCYALPDSYTSEALAPFLCGGLIGFRALETVPKAKKIGFYGFGSSAHLLIQIAKLRGQKVYVFTRPQDQTAQELAQKLGAIWVGSSEEKAPEPLDAAILFAPVGELIPKALQSIDRGGSLICAGIHMSDIPSFSYDLLYGERVIRSITNLTRLDGEKFLTIAQSHPLHTQVTCYALENANQALDDLRKGKVTGSVVLKID